MIELAYAPACLAYGLACYWLLFRRDRLWRAYRVLRGQHERRGRQVWPYGDLDELTADEDPRVPGLDICRECRRQIPRRAWEHDVTCSYYREPEQAGAYVNGLHFTREELQDTCKSNSLNLDPITRAEACKKLAELRGKVARLNSRPIRIGPPY